MTREEIYDAQIAPLMGEILRICKEHKLPMLADFDLSSDEDEGLKCTSALLDETWNPAEAMVQAFGILRPRSRSPLMMTVEHADGSKEITAIL